MRVVMLVPRREDHGHRDRVWNWLKPKLPFSVVEGHHDEGPFNRAAAINRAAELAGDWDVAIINDADCLAPVAQYREAVERATDTGQLAMAFDTFNQLSEHGTDWVLSGYFENLASVVTTWTADLGNSPCAVSRLLWDRVGGFDERFIGWGHEDNGFRLACEGLADCQWVPGPLYHFWHTPGPREQSPTFQDNCDLYLAYEQALAEGRMNEFLGARV